MTYSVFLSSTFGDFQEERRALMDTIPYVDLHVHVAERKGLNPTKTLEQHLEDWIDKSDAVVLLVGLRYGSKSDDGVSWTEKEVHYALSRNKYVFCYIRDHPEIDLKNIDLPKELEHFISTIEDRIPIVPRYSYGEVYKLIAMVNRDLDRWAGQKEEKERKANYYDSFE